MKTDDRAELAKLPDPDVYALLANICKRDFYEFVQTFWSTIVKEPPVWNWHIQLLCDELQIVAERVFRRDPKEYDLIINVPPGSSKSTVCSQMFPAWCWTRDPTLRFIGGSYEYEVQMEQAEAQRQIVSSELYQRMFPDVRLHPTRNARHNYRTTAGGQRYSRGVGGAITGVHAHIQLVDDPLNPKEAASKADIKAANHWMTQTLSGRKVDKRLTPLILIQQRLHEDDPSGQALRTRPSEIRHICLPAEDTADVRPPELRSMYKDGLFDPVRLPRSVLNSEKIVLGSFGYSGQMLQRPSPEDGGIVKRGWFKIFTMEDVLGLARIWMPGAPVWNFTADLAYTKDEINDPSAVLAYARIGPYVAIRNVKAAHLEQPELERMLPAWTTSNGYSERSVLRIEPKANGLSTIQNLRARTGINVTGSKAPEKDKVARLRDVSPLIECGRVILIDGDWIETFLDEACKVPFARHWDMTDCLMIALDQEAKAGLGSASMDRTRSTDGFAATGKAARTAAEVWDGLV